MKRPKYVVRLLAVIALLSMMLVGTAATATAQVTEDVEFPDALTGDFNEIYFAAVGNGDDFGLGAAQTSITVQNIDDEDGFIFIFVGADNDYEEATYAQLNAGASKTFTADDLGIAEGTVAPVIVAGYDTLSFDETIVDNYIGIAGVAKQAVTGDSLPYTTAADTSVSGYNAVSGREVGFQDEMYLPIVQTNCGPGGCWDTAIRVSNVGFFENAAATIRFFPSDDGSGSLQTGFQVEALLGLGETWTVNLSELVPEGWVGSAQIFSDDQVVAIADRFKAGTDMWITNTASNAAAESEYQFGAPYVLFAPDVRLDYNGWNTGINVANTVNMENQVNIQYFGNNGNAPQGQSQRLSAQGMTYFYNPSDPSEDDCSQPADQVPTCDFVGGAVIISTSPVAVAVDGVKYFGNDENVGQAFSYAATANVFQFQAAPLVQKGTASTGMGDTSGINFLNPNAEATFVSVDWVNPSGFQADNFGNSVVWVPGFSTGFVYTMFQINLPNGFTGSAIVTSELPIAATTANVNYAVNGDGTAIWNLYNPCGFFRQLGDCVFVPAPEPLATKVIDTEEAGALVCVYNAGVDQDGKPTPIDVTEEDCELLNVVDKNAEAPGQGEEQPFFAVDDDGNPALTLFFDAENNVFTTDVFGENDADLDISLFNFTEFVDGNEQAADTNATCADVDSGAASNETVLDGTVGGDEVALLGDLENAVIVVTDAEGNEIFCGQVEAGEVRQETNEEAAARLGAVAVGVTDADGNVEFDLPAGDYFAIVNADGFEIAVEEFSLEPGETEVNEVVLEDAVVTPPPADTAKVIDTNVADALVCVFDRGVDQDGKPLPIDATSEDCELLGVVDKGDDGGGQGGPDSFLAFFDGAQVVDGQTVENGATIQNFTADNKLVVDVILDGVAADSTFPVQLFFDTDIVDGEQVAGGNLTCADAQADPLGENTEFVDLGTVTSDAFGNVSAEVTTTLSADTVQLIGDLENAVLVVGEDCSQIESGIIREETLAEAQARLGAVAIGVTDANGDITFPLEPGDYFAIINAEGFELAVEEFTLVEGETEVNEVNLVGVVTPVGTGSITKFFETTGGEPIDELRVTISNDAGDVVVAGPVDDDGSVFAGQLVPGTYTISWNDISNPNDLVGYASGMETVEVAEDEDVVLTNTLEALAVLQACVQDDVTGEPLPGAFVTVIDFETGALVDFGFTGGTLPIVDTAGVATFLVEPGNYSVSASALGYTSSSADVIVTTEDPAADGCDVVIGLEPSAIVNAGFITKTVEFDGEPVADATVILVEPTAAGEVPEITVEAILAGETNILGADVTDASGVVSFEVQGGASYGIAVIGVDATGEDFIVLSSEVVTVGVGEEIFPVNELNTAAGILDVVGVNATADAGTFYVDVDVYAAEVGDTAAGFCQGEQVGEVFDFAAAEVDAEFLLTPGTYCVEYFVEYSDTVTGEHFDISGFAPNVTLPVGDPATDVDVEIDLQGQSPV